MIDLDDPLLRSAFANADETPPSGVLAGTWIRDTEHMLLYTWLEAALQVSANPLEFARRDGLIRSACFMPVTFLNAVTHFMYRVGTATIEDMQDASHYVYPTSTPVSFRCFDERVPAVPRRRRWVELLPMPEDLGPTMWPTLADLTQTDCFHAQFRQRVHRLSARQLDGDLIRIAFPECGEPLPPSPFN